MTRDVVRPAHLNILNNVYEVQPYLSAYKRLIKENLPRMSDKWLLKEFNDSFIKQINAKISNNWSAYETIKWMSYMHKFNVINWIPYEISKFSQYTKSNDDCSTLQNSGIMVEPESMYFFSSKDKNPIMTSKS